MRNKISEIEQQGEDIKSIIINLEKAYLKDDKFPVFHKETLIWKMVDFYKIS